MNAAGLSLLLGSYTLVDGFWGRGTGRERMILPWGSSHEECNHLPLCIWTTQNGLVLFFLFFLLFLLEGESQGSRGADLGGLGGKHNQWT